MAKRRNHAERLRNSISAMPNATKEAMLRGIRSNRVIVGAYVDKRGGICPMLAAHRNGGRTSFISFAKAWDRFAGTKRARRATERELRVLIAHLEESIAAEEGIDLAEAISDHARLTAARPRPRAGDPDRSTELQRRAGWAWLRPFRRLDDYERALQRAERGPEAEPASEAERV
jgi:hypothetical protein